MIVRLLAAAAIGLALPAAAALAQEGSPPVAAAGDRGHGPHGGPGGPVDERHGPQIFLSPAGEPFHAPPEAPYPVAAWFAEADTDHDGALTPAEFAADFTRFFDRVDTDHDGVIDGFEVGDYEKKIAPEVMPRMYREEADDESAQGDDRSGIDRGGPPGGGPPGGGGRRGGGGPPGGGMGGPGRTGGDHRRGGAGPSVDGAAAYSLINLPEPVSGADADFDGKVTRAEWAQAAKVRFKLLDKNGDGAITLAELPLTRVQRLATQPPKPEKRGLFGGGKPRRPPEM